MTTNEALEYNTIAANYFVNNSKTISRGNPLVQLQIIMESEDKEIFGYFDQKTNSIFIILRNIECFVDRKTCMQPISPADKGPAFNKRSAFISVMLDTVTHELFHAGQCIDPFSYAKNDLYKYTEIEAPVIAKTHEFMTVNSSILENLYGFKYTLLSPYHYAYNDPKYLEGYKPLFLDQTIASVLKNICSSECYVSDILSECARHEVNMITIILPTLPEPDVRTFAIYKVGMMFDDFYGSIYEALKFIHENPMYFCGDAKLTFEIQVDDTAMMTLTGVKGKLIPITSIS